MVTSGHVTEMAVTQLTICRIRKRLATRKPNASIFYRTKVMGDKVCIAGIGVLDVFGSCDLDLDPMTFIYELVP